MMKRLFILLSLLSHTFLPSAQKVISIQVNGTINPASAAFIKSGIDKATDEKAACLLIHLNTPGGLLKSTRVIVGDILQSPVPVIVYVSPGGAHAGSAGVFITMAAHVAAMAPSTNIGAAHPVSGGGAQMDSVMSSKTTNDAAAFIRTIAEKRQRNLDWAEEAVRNSVSITEAEAVQKGVVDLVAKDESDLFKQINGREVEVASGKVTLQTANAAVDRMEMNFVEKLLNTISDPNIAYILMMIGFYGMLFELYSPGAIVPGVIGGICLILAFYAMHTLPLNYAGLALIIFSIILFILEIKVTSYGVLGIGGAVALALGSIMLIRTESALEIIRISWTLIIGTTVLTILFFSLLLALVVRGQKIKPVSGVEGMIGAVGETLDVLQPAGMIRIHGELWRAESGGEMIAGGQKVRVTAVKNLTLLVELV
jgi:membrane-bound serine protease (ClpP class)